MEFKVGDYVTFFGLTIRIYGYIARINEDDSVDYVRESLTRWNASKSIVERGRIITEEEFIERVKSNAEKSDYPAPLTKNVKEVLKKFTENFDINQSEIKAILKVI